MCKMSALDSIGSHDNIHCKSLAISSICLTNLRGGDYGKVGESLGWSYEVRLSRFLTIV
jgi:hypothetical protein